VVGGILTLVATSRSAGSKGWGYVGGALDIVFGILIAVIAITSPGGAFLATVWIAAIGAIIIGVVLLVLAFRMRRADGVVTQEAATVAVRAAPTAGGESGGTNERIRNCAIDRGRGRAVTDPGARHELPRVAALVAVRAGGRRPRARLPRRGPRRRGGVRL